MKAAEHGWIVDILKNRLAFTFLSVSVFTRICVGAHMRQSSRKWNGQTCRSTEDISSSVTRPIFHYTWTHFPHVKPVYSRFPICSWGMWKTVLVILSGAGLYYKVCKNRQPQPPIEWSSLINSTLKGDKNKGVAEKRQEENGKTEEERDA